VVADTPAVESFKNRNEFIGYLCVYAHPESARRCLGYLSYTNAKPNDWSIQRVRSAQIAYCFWPKKNMDHGSTHDYYTIIRCNHKCRILNICFSFFLILPLDHAVLYNAIDIRYTHTGVCGKSM